MAKLYDPLLTPEWRIAIEPKSLADDTLKSIRIVTGRIAALTGLTLATDTVRPAYNTLSINLADIEYVNALASDAIPVVAGELNGNSAIKSGELSVKQFIALPESVGKYRFRSSISDIDAFGLDIGAHTALVGRDFYYENGYYWFNEHPSKFGSIGVDGDLTKLALPCLGGALATSQMPLGVAYRDCADYTTLQAIQESLYGNSPNGLTSSLLYAIGGMHLSESPIDREWEEGDYYLGITESGELVYAPKVSGVRFVIGKKVDTSQLFSPGEYFLVPTSLDNYILGLTERHNITDFPGIAKDFPQLDEYFTGADVLYLMYARGCIFYHLKYINNAAGSQQALSDFIVNTGKVIITANAEASAVVSLGTLPVLPGLTVISTDTTGTTNIV